jgi:hypothetical protein
MSDAPSAPQSSPVDQFASGDTLVDGYAGSRAGTGKTTRLIEWFREQHDDETVRMLIDPAGDTLPEADDGMGFTPVSIDSRHATYKYSVTGGDR